MKKFIALILSVSFMFSSAAVIYADDWAAFNGAKAAEEAGDFARARELYARYLATATDIWNVPLSKMKINALDAILEVYYEAPESSAVYFGAKHEPRSGVYFGTTYSREGREFYNDRAALRSRYPNAESAYLIYLEFDQRESLSQNVTNGVYFNDLRPHFTPDSVIMLAWNIYKPHGDGIASYSDYINSTLQTLQETGSKVLLRFGAEMNVGVSGTVGGNPAPEEFKKAFRYVAERARQYSNIAMVWSPNDVGAIDRSFEMYYPGNEYVDWVGVSLYSLKYFQANPNTTLVDATYFLTGQFSHPLIKLRHIDNFMKENNINKPLMISESGAAHRINTLGEDTTDWSLMQVRRMYQDLPRYFPNLKAILYFNVDMPGERFNYAFYSSPRLLSLYNELTSEKHFLKAGQSSAGMSYKRLNGDSFSRGASINLSASAYYPYADNIRIEYSVGGRVLATADQTPYKYMFDTSSLSAGAHTLTVKAFQDGKLLNEISRGFNITESSAPAASDGGVKVLFNENPLDHLLLSAVFSRFLE